MHLVSMVERVSNNCNDVSMDGNQLLTYLDEARHVYDVDYISSSDDDYFERSNNINYLISVGILIL